MKMISIGQGRSLNPAYVALMEKARTAPGGLPLTPLLTLTLQNGAQISVTHDPSGGVDIDAIESQILAVLEGGAG